MNDWPQGWYCDERRAWPAGSGGSGWAGPPTSDLTTRRPAGSGWPGAGWPSQPPDRTAPGRESRLPPAGWPPARGRRRWGPKRILKIVAAVVLLAVVASVGYYFFLNSKLTRINALAGDPGRPAAGAGTNWLLTGSDSRGGLSRTEEDQLALGHDITGARTDTIMVLHLPANGNPPILMSIPRDSYVSIPGHGYNKINAAYPSAARNCSPRPCRTPPACTSAITWGSGWAAWPVWSTTSAVSGCACPGRWSTRRPG